MTQADSSTTLTAPATPAADMAATLDTGYGPEALAPDHSPVRSIPGDTDEHLEDGIALCLSGGGYRAMLFHVGSLLRLNELGLLGKLDRISSVSGGSITAGLLGLRWRALGFDATTGKAPDDRFQELIVTPLRALASRSIDVPSVGWGALLPGSVADFITRAYRKHLFGDATLQDLPGAGEGPRFILNATNVQSGVLWRFSKPYMSDWRVGLVRNPDLSLATAVAASSAFPPVLSPLTLDLDPAAFDTTTGAHLTEDVYRDRVTLTDGGVYDNLGLETAWKRYRTILVSDAGGRSGTEPEPAGDWARHGLRIIGMLYDQVGVLRVRQVMDAFARQERSGAFWSTRSNLDAFKVADALPCPLARTRELALVKTRLARLDANTQERLINWGYAACDGALRAWYDSRLPAPNRFPYPATGV